MSRKINAFIVVITLILSSELNAQWTGQEVNATYHLYAIDAVTDNVVFTGGYGGSILKSVDGGDSWTNLSLTTTNWVTAIEFFDENNGWVTTETSNLSNSGGIQKTTDGGLTWTTSQNSRDYLSMDWVTNGIGYVGAWDGFMEKTTDGGITWEVLSLPTGNAIIDIQFLDQNHGFATTNNYELLRTSDGGLNWELFFHNGIERIHFRNAMSGYCVDYDGRIGRTTDGGTTFAYWQSPFDFKINDIYFVNDLIGYAVGGLDCSSGDCIQSPILLTTADGGITWTNNSHPYVGQPIGFFQVDVTPNGTPFISGSNKIVLRNEGLAGLENKPLNTLSVFPNPVTDMIQIELPTNAKKWVIWNSIGMIVKESVLSGGSMTSINMTDFQAGMYSIGLFDGESTSLGMSRFIKD